MRYVKNLLTYIGNIQNFKLSIQQLYQRTADDWQLSIYYIIALKFLKKQYEIGNNKNIDMKKEIGRKLTLQLVLFVCHGDEVTVLQTKIKC